MSTFGAWSSTVVMATRLCPVWSKGSATGNVQDGPGAVRSRPSTTRLSLVNSCCGWSSTSHLEFLLLGNQLCIHEIVDGLYFHYNLSLYVFMSVCMSITVLVTG